MAGAALEEAGGAPNPGELLVEFGGRACYRSWEPGLNVNVTRVRTDRREYFENLLRTPTAACSSTRATLRASQRLARVHARARRHRAGSAFSQESLRYVRLTDIGFRVPPALEPLREQRSRSSSSSRSSSARRPIRSARRRGRAVPRQEGGHLGAAAPRADRPLDGHRLEANRARCVTSSRCAPPRAPRRSCEASSTRSRRSCSRGAADVPGLRARRRRLLAAALPQGVTSAGHRPSWPVPSRAGRGLWRAIPPGRARPRR